MLMLKLLIELPIFQYEPNNHHNKIRNQTTPHKTTNNTRRHSHDEITKKKFSVCKNHLFILKYNEKDEER